MPIKRGMAGEKRDLPQQLRRDLVRVNPQHMIARIRQELLAGNLPLIDRSHLFVRTPILFPTINLQDQKTRDQ